MSKYQALLLGCTIGLILFTVPVHAAGEKTNDLRFIGCSGEAAELTLRIKNHVLLHKDFLADKAGDEKEYLEAVELQLKYVFGYFHNQPKLNTVLATSPTAPRIKIHRTSSTSYPFDLEIDKIDHPDVKISLPYQKKALDRGRTTQKDSAVRIEYSAEIEAMRCGKNPLKQELELALPSDPYLAYWYVAPRSRRLLKWRHVQGVTNPCADPELADIPHPEFYWYFWNPVRSAFDAKGKLYHCSELLKESFHFHKVGAEIVERRSPSNAHPLLSFDKFPKEKTLRASVVFGIIDAKLASFPTQGLSGLKPALKGESKAPLDAYLDSLLKSEEELDRGSRYFANFLLGLPAVMDISAVKVLENQSYLQLQIQGLLVKSRREIKLRAYFGPTDLLAGKPPQHWRLLKSALETDHLLFYNGHSGLGENLALHNINDSAVSGILEPIEFDRAPSYQLVAYLSCYSYNYFGRDLLRARAERANTTATDVVYTASNFTSERGPLGLLDYMDRVLSSNAPKKEKFHKHPYFVEDDVIIITSQENSGQ